MWQTYPRYDPRAREATEGKNETCEKTNTVVKYQATMANARNGPAVIVNGAAELRLGRAEHELERLEFRKGGDDGKVGMPWRPPFSDF